MWHHDLPFRRLHARLLRYAPRRDTPPLRVSYINEAGLVNSLQLLCILLASMYGSDAADAGGEAGPGTREAKYSAEFNRRASVVLEHFGSTHPGNLMAAARFLAQETWPEALFASDYRPNDPTGRNELLDRARNYVRYGEREHNSDTWKPRG
jgi:hypothetical protein